MNQGLRRRWNINRDEGEEEMNGKWRNGDEE